MIWAAHMQARADARKSLRAAQVERLSRQIGDLYGPLCSLYETGEAHHHAFLQSYSKDPTSEVKYRTFAPDYAGMFEPPGREALAAFRNWTTAVFMETNVKIDELIRRHADLIVGTEIPQVLVQMSAHVAATRIMVEAWSHDSFTEREEDEVAHMPISSHPPSLKHYARAAFAVLKAELLRLQADRTAVVDEEELSRRIDGLTTDSRDEFEKARAISRGHPRPEGLVRRPRPGPPFVPSPPAAEPEQAPDLQGDRGLQVR